MDIKELETAQGIRTENLMVRMTPEEKMLMVSEAQKLGISLSAFVRLILRNWAGTIKIEKKQ